ncbi:phototropic-responsive NPH3 family protein [Actinidia rufa]|uniref:Phototropic-responsive NPH3 family protein n=1 Tax=Actinidia rufa TaxID=165716 RepID=A0A7J0FIK9_9ERIC|nr:phototropic-responsive NPH3 family protein [Actinidia rufa]
MMDLNDQPATPQPITPTMSAKKMELLSTAMKRTSELIFSQEVSSDVTIHAGGTSFSLHKFPLTSKCGYIRKLVSESSEADLSTLELTNVPGGAKAFELVEKFCYGINFEISIENIAMLRCVAEYLDMTDDAAVGNLVRRTDANLNEMALKKPCQCDFHFAQLRKPPSNSRGSENSEPESFGKGRKKIEPRQEHQKRVVVETIISLLPREKNAMSVSFPSMLLQAAIHLETTVVCWLEKRMGLQLDQTVLDDLLIPSFSFTGHTLFDVDSVERIVKNYLEYNVEGKHLGCSAEGSFLSPPRSEKERVGKLM